MSVSGSTGSGLDPTARDFGVHDAEAENIASLNSGQAPGFGQVGLNSPLFAEAEALDGVASGAEELTVSPEKKDSVRLVQQALKQLGFLRGSVDGQFGRMQTEPAVVAFQRDQGMTPTGRVDAQTLLALDEALVRGDGIATPGTPNDIVFIGMGDGAAYEAADLRKAGASVLGITDQAGSNQLTVTLGGRKQTYDLSNREGIDRYVADLGLAGSTATKAAEIIEGGGGGEPREVTDSRGQVRAKDARDEVALAVKAFAEAERGERTLERLVLSGHSVGTGVWGDHNGEFRMKTLGQIAELFPTAARQVEDFMVAGCYSNSEADVDDFREMFPNLKTVWAYGGSAPGTWTGAMTHNRAWEAATRGHDPSIVDRTLAEGTRKGEEVATWNLVDGYQADGERRELAAVKAEMDELSPVIASFMAGETEVENTQEGPLREYYGLVQEALGHRGLPTGVRADLERERDATIRRIFYDEPVRRRFQEAYGAQLTAGYAQLGLSAPDFGELSRKDALAAIEAYRSVLSAAGAPQGAASRAYELLVGLESLSANVIPNSWV